MSQDQLEDDLFLSIYLVVWYFMKYTMAAIISPLTSLGPGVMRIKLCQRFYNCIMHKWLCVFSYSTSYVNCMWIDICNGDFRPLKF